MDTPPVANLPAPAEQDQSWAGKKLTLEWIAGIIVMAIFSCACCLLSARISGENIAFSAGLTVGGIIWPLLITALFSIASYFRKAPRRLALVAMATFGLFGISNLSASLHQKVANSAAIDAMGEEVKGIQRQAAQANDLKEQEAIVQRAEAMLRNAPDKMSTKQAADEMRALAKFVDPILNQSRAYSAAMRIFFGDDTNWADRYTGTKEALAAGRASLAKLRQQQNALAQTIERIYSSVSIMIENRDTSAGISMDGLRGMYSAYLAKAQGMKKLNTTSAQLYERIDDALAMLQTEWGQWSKSSDGAFIIWDDDNLSKKFKTINQDIVTLSARQEAYQKALLNQN